MQKLYNDKFVQDINYQGFLEEKIRRGVSDLYAAFQPFNESTRALYPLLDLLRESLQPGDLILDTWCRTGWSGELLAGLFPEQRVISLWEGDSNVLGYQGFSYWLGTGKRSSNLDILFAHPDYPLPLADGCVKVVHGLDALHRYRHASFIPECFRICNQTGVLIFPHIHLTNSQPKPFFERGCQQYHGREWKDWLDALLINKNRTGWLLPEAGLFEPNALTHLVDHSDTEHYNALLLIADRRHQGRSLLSTTYPVLAHNSRLVANPLLEVNPNLCQVNRNTKTLGGLASVMLTRHPCYAQRLADNRDDRLDSEEARLFWYASRGFCLQDIANVMSISFEQVKYLAEKLCQRELLHPAVVSQSMYELQHFYSFVNLPISTPSNFPALWEKALGQFSQRPLLHWLKDDSELMMDEASFLVDGIRVGLQVAGLVRGNRIVVASEHHPQALLLCWAAWLEGIVTVFLDVTQPDTQLVYLCECCNASWLFTDSPTLVHGQTILFDGVKQSDITNFSDWVEPYLECDISNTQVEPDDPAAILFTSGSSGNPKGVVLSQQAICHSGATMVHAHGWCEERLLSLGPFSMMSGLRNPALAALISGSTILLPDRVTCQFPLTAWEQAATQEATVITSVPAWLQGLLAVADRLIQSSKLKQILLTGSPLAASLRRAARLQLGVTIGNYYGLTESGGVCLVSLDEDDESLGYPVGALVQIVNADDKPVSIGEEGRLKVHSTQLMSGYLNDPVGSTQLLRNGWLWTGDKARWDEKGRLWLVGREDSMLKLRSGERFYPTELESKLSALFGVKAAAVTVYGGEQRLIAFLVTDRSILELRTDLAQQVSPQFVPDQIIRVESLPLGNNGKLRRQILIQMVEKI